MNLLTILIIILSALLLIYIIAGLIIAYKIYKIEFRHRYENNPNIKYYSFSEFNLNQRLIEIPYKKETLRGYLVDNGNYDKNKLVIFCHGATSTIDAYAQDISYIALKGYQVLAINYIGVGMSTGNSLIGGSGSLFSTYQILKYVKNNPEFKDKEIYTIGHSWGSYAASNIVKYFKDIKGFVALATYRKPTLALGNINKKYYIFLPFLFLIDYFHEGKFILDNFLKSIKKYNGKGLVIHSNNDPIIDFNKNFIYLKEHTKNKNIEFMEVENRLHNPEYTIAAANSYIEFTKKLNSYNTIDEKIEYMKTVDFHALGELDTVIMDKIVDFIG